MEIKEVNKVNEEKKDIYKNICYEMDTNKLMLIDSENHQNLCDVFGRKKIKFLPNVTGSINRFESKNIFLGNNGSFLKSQNSTPKTINTKKRNSRNILNNTLDKNQINYFPTIRKFEGYSKFPRPIGPPLMNVPDYEFKEKNKRKFIGNLNDYFQDYKVKNKILMPNENNGVSFLTSDLNQYDLIKNDTDHSLQLIQNTLNNYKEEYKLKLHVMHKDPNVKALNQFKKKLLLNKDSKIINGRILPEPCEKIQKYNKIIQSVVNRAGLHFDKRLNNNLNRNNKTISRCKDNFHDYLNIKNISIIKSHDRLNDLHKSKDFTIGRLINMDFGFSSDKNINLTSNDNNNNQLPDIQRTVMGINRNLNNMIIDDDYKETQETLMNDSNINSNNNNKTVKKKTLEEKINDNELSFLSYMSEIEKKYAEENDKKIKFIKSTNAKGEHLNKLLLGYQEKPRKPPTFFQKSRNLKLKNNRDLYLENMNLLRMTNKEAFKLQDQKELYDLKMLEKKIRISTINANNVMKGKTLKITEENKI